MRYVNSEGVELVFGENGLFANENELRDYSWKYSSSGNYINGFHKTITDKKLPIIIFANSEKEGLAKKNDMYELFDTDVVKNKVGRLYIGEYYLECFITDSSKSIYLQSKRELHVDLKVSSNGKWIKENTIDFSQESHSPGGFDYEYDYEYDFGLENAGESTLTNEHFYDVNFIITVSGQCTNPSITIGDNTYTVNVELNLGDNLFINSKEKTIYVIRANGYYENRFASRDRSNYIFEPIKSGYQKVSWNGEYRWQITLIEERSEPKWT